MSVDILANSPSSVALAELFGSNCSFRNYYFMFQADFGFLVVVFSVKRNTAENERRWKRRMWGNKEGN